VAGAGETKVALQRTKQTKVNPVCSGEQRDAAVEARRGFVYSPSPPLAISGNV
jgi:hypothetical protein